jgi:NAD(P)-dependent dehydrogenase (short-subunit alcohol dehydrogenase family)
MRLKDKVALVTGGSRSIGRAICLGFAREGADVAVNYVQDATAADEVVQVIRGLGRQAIAVQADVSQAKQVQAMVTKVVDTFGRIDVLVNNAAQILRSPFLEITEELWDHVIDVDLKGEFLVGQAVARQMVKQKSGAIINVSSICATLAQYELAHYQAAKGGINALSRGMALELAPHGIRVNVLQPGVISTDVNRTLFATPESRTARAAKIPLNRLGTPEDLVGAAIYLASGESAFTTGIALPVDGGEPIW